MPLAIQFRVVQEHVLFKLSTSIVHFLITSLHRNDYNVGFQHLFKFWNITETTLSDGYTCLLYQFFASERKAFSVAFAHFHVSQVGSMLFLRPCRPKSWGQRGPAPRAPWIHECIIITPFLWLHWFCLVHHHHSSNITLQKRTWHWMNLTNQLWSCIAEFSFHYRVQTPESRPAGCVACVLLLQSPPQSLGVLCLISLALSSTWCNLLRTVLKCETAREKVNLYVYCNIRLVFFQHI